MGLGISNDPCSQNVFILYQDLLLLSVPQKPRIEPCSILLVRRKEFELSAGRGDDAPSTMHLKPPWVSHHIFYLCFAYSYPCLHGQPLFPKDRQSYSSRLSRLTKTRLLSSLVIMPCKPTLAIALFLINFPVFIVSKTIDVIFEQLANKA